MKKENKMDFRAETVAEEYAELVGRMKAFEAYLRTEESALVEKKSVLRNAGPLHQRKRIKVGSTGTDIPHGAAYLT